MGCRFGGPYLGEIVSPRCGGAPRTVNLYGIGDPADAAGWEVGFLTATIPTSSTAATAMAASIAVFCRLQQPPPPPSAPLPARCGSPKPGSRQHRTRLTLSERTRFRASALDLDDSQKARLFLVRIDENGERCIRRRTQTLEVDVPAGMWELIVEVQERAAEEGRMLVLLARDPR